MADFFENTSDGNPLPDTGIISVDEVKNVDGVANSLKEVEGVAYVNYGEESELAAFSNITTIVRQTLSVLFWVFFRLASLSPPKIPGRFHGLRRPGLAHGRYKHIRHDRIRLS